MPIIAAPLEALAVLGALKWHSLSTAVLKKSPGFVLSGIPMYYITRQGASIPLSRFREYPVCRPDKLYTSCIFDSDFVSSAITTLRSVYKGTRIWVAASRY
jgi:hypothetical protein